jgi:hypothetical protein
LQITTGSANLQQELITQRFASDKLTNNGIYDAQGALRIAPWNKQQCVNGT